MGTVTRLSARWLGGMLVVWLAAALISGELFGGETNQASQELAATPTDAVLTVHEGMLSLRAHDASLKAIFEAIGRQLSIEVVTRLPAAERITLAFEQLSLMEALKRFRPYVNYVVLQDAAKAPSTIRKLIVFSKRAAGVPRPPATKDDEALAPASPRQHPDPAPEAPARPKPFSFEFDPAAGMERGR